MLQGRDKVSLPDNPDERATVVEALRIIEEYAIWSQGITYEQLGYRNWAGEIPARKIDEHMLCKHFFDQANKDRKT